MVEARVQFGGRTTDPENMALAIEESRILATGDWRFVGKKRHSRRSAALVLHGLYGEQVPRVTELIVDIEAEARRMGPAFLMKIGPREFMVQR